MRDDIRRERRIKEKQRKQYRREEKQAEEFLKNFLDSNAYENEMVVTSEDDLSEKKQELLR